MARNSSTAIARRNRKSEILSKRKRRLDESDDWWIKGGLISAGGTVATAGAGVVTAVLSLSTLSGLSFALMGLFMVAFIIFGGAGAMRFFKG